MIFNKLLTSSEHRNRNKPFYIYKGLIQWQKADPAYIASIFLTLHKRLCVDIGIFFLPETSPCEMRPWFDDMIMMTILFMVIINKYS